MSSLSTLILTLSSLQIAIYLTLLSLCILKFTSVCRSSLRFIHAFYGIVFVYILLELAIQLYQLLGLLLDTFQDNFNVVLAANVFCMIADIFILLIFTMYWKQVQGSFVEGFVESSADTVIRKRFILPTLYFILYTAYFCYLCITGDILILG